MCQSGIDLSNVDAVIITLDASDTEEGTEDDGEAGDENDDGDISGVQPLEWSWQTSRQLQVNFPSTQLPPGSHKTSEKNDVWLIESQRH